VVNASPVTSRKVGLLLVPFRCCRCSVVLFPDALLDGGPCGHVAAQASPCGH